MLIKGWVEGWHILRALHLLLTLLLYAHFRDSRFYSDLDQDVLSPPVAVAYMLLLDVILSFRSLRINRPAFLSEVNALLIMELFVNVRFEQDWSEISTSLPDNALLQWTRLIYSKIACHTDIIFRSLNQLYLLRRI